MSASENSAPPTAVAPVAEQSPRPTANEAKGPTDEAPRSEGKAPAPEAAAPEHETKAAQPSEPSASNPATPASQPDEDESPAEANTSAATTQDDAQPPLPHEPVPEPEDDGWTYEWDPTHQAYYFANRFTGQTTWENPRQANTPAANTSSTAAPAPPPLPTAIGGYNPAIHGNYDDWLAQQKENGVAPPEDDAADPTETPTVDPAAAALYVSGTQFNRWTGRHQQADGGPERHSDEAKARRQMNAFFDVDAAANSHDGRSLRAERAGKRLTKTELKHFKEKRKAKKEEKRRAWLKD